ncbi:SAM-dependent methyltransferase [Amycolatopsis sp. lyj-346]|uniref:SAM-dependent methyltransferase n=1 Tax=Amycolatopsis sp. lyj-346 TaxID=2789289 RepID=UPI00397A149C
MTEHSADLITADAIAEYYDGSVEAFGILLGEGGSIHSGYWPDGERDVSFTRARLNLTELVGDRCRLAPGQRLLDVGSGLGGPAIHLAGACEVRVTGITLSGKQVETSRAKAAAVGCDLVDFHCADALALPFEDGSFDAVMFVETMMHIEDRATAFAEARRVLRPGGRVVVADFVEDTPLSTVESGMLKSVVRSPFMPTREHYRKLAEGNGFSVEEMLDITKQVRPTAEHYNRAVVAARRKLSEAYGVSGAGAIAAMINAFGRVAVRAHGYLLLVAAKP